MIQTNLRIFLYEEIPHFNLDTLETLKERLQNGEKIIRQRKLEDFF